MAAAVVSGSLKMLSHFENGRLLVTITLPRSYRSASSVNSTSTSFRLCCTYPPPQSFAEACAARRKTTELKHPRHSKTVRCSSPTAESEPTAVATPPPSLHDSELPRPFSPAEPRIRLRTRPA